MNPHHIVQNLSFDQENMILSVDGSTYSIPISQASKRLSQATEAERKLYQISPSGYGIHWLAIDEDLSIDGLIRLANSLPVQNASRF
ncbi:DUF2442 domain-containing protein [Synechococcus elongatus]|uniref:Uncharacterized protein SEE0018 n=2 Tax=Synechococcus elongatus TaxID=32046 RepID=Q8KPS6_SYNE7|nr:DUF2442 domain-containing protein [Synechococcus elongatus]AAM82693.1 unknown [Synechococcus elongatus PCC 7942 = FACHB-805]ABB57239.1 conserved hypothetical protein [Synechococcus elongatus PCC 7942 = FACHB-805]AJD58248.1 hypothetical protein M744_10605 [Synechococcus elongatus UTEX 2973]MBD2587644.1 DUF2442 domain-containing protein [Synechococcus elongatus FACHB-242]MBD2688577.1 DUF2442 domain-containing protein [Synechococcus elongatus FACHB-1061]